MNLSWYVNFLKISSARVLAAFGMFLLSVVIGQKFGPAGLGEFTFWLSLAIVLGLVARLGLDGCLLKLVAADNAGGDHYPLMTAYRWTLVQTLSSSLALVAFVFFVVYATGADMPIFAVWIVLSIPGLTLLGIVAGYLRGRNFNTVVALIDVGGVGAVTFLILFFLLQADVQTDLAMISSLFFYATVGMAATGVLFCYKRISSGSDHMSSGNPGQRKKFHTDQIHFFVVLVGGFLMQAGSFSLAAYSLDNDTLGILRAAERLTTLIVFPTIAVNLMLTSQIASKFGQGDQAGIARVIKKSGLVCLVISTTTSLPLIIFSEFFLGLFGEGFADGQTFLIMLAIAQILIASSSPILSALSFTNQGQRATQITLYSTLVGVILFPLLSYLYDGLGFGLAFFAVSLCKSAMTVSLGRNFLRTES